VGKKVDYAGRRVVLQLGDMRATWIGEIHRVVEGLFLEPGVEEFQRIVHRRVVCAGNVLVALGTVRTRHTEQSVLELDVATARFKKMRGDLLAFQDDLVGGLCQRGPADRE